MSRLAQSTVVSNITFQPTLRAFGAWAARHGAVAGRRRRASGAREPGLNVSKPLNTSNPVVQCGDGEDD